jgi:hypothetical protein
MKKLYILFIAAVIPILLLAQETNPDTSFWKNSLRFGVNYNFTSFSDNWTGGGINAWAMNSFVRGNANYQKEKITWANETELLYGRSKNDEQEASRKTVDKIYLDSKLGYKVSNKWNMFGSLQFLSQFDDGFRYEDDTKEKISGFLTPAFITSSWGMEYKPVDHFWLRIGPFSPRITILNDTSLYRNVPENYGVDVGEKIRFEWLAFQFLANYDKEIVGNITLSAKYQLFANYQNLAIKKIDHRLDLLITAQIYEFLNMSFGSILVYDFDQIDEIQSSQLLSLGLLFHLGHKED